MLSRLPPLNFDYEYDTPPLREAPDRHDSKLQREWLIAYFSQLAPDFLGWLEDPNLDEYVTGDDTAKYCLDAGIPTFEDWASDREYLESISFGG